MAREHRLQIDTSLELSRFASQVSFLTLRLDLCAVEIGGIPDFFELFF